jgi:hypothetical protein
MPAHPSEGPAAGGAVTVVEVVVFEALPLRARGARRAVVRWSDGAVGEALRWYDDEVLIRESELVGKTAAEIGELHFRRDLDYLRAPDSPDD